MNNSGIPSAGAFLIAAACAGVIAVATMIAMPTVEPVLVATAAVIGGIVSPGGQWATNFVSNVVVPILPILFPFIAFLVVLYRMSRGYRPV